MQVGPKYKICKRLGNGVFEKCQTQKFTLSEARKANVRGSRRRPRSLSDYGRQLLEKQKVRFTYGVSERQLSRYAEVAVSGQTRPADFLLSTLETRLDNVVYRLGLAPTRRSARQMVSHGHITVNGRKVTIPSYSVTKGEQLGIRDGSKEKTLFVGLADRLAEHTAPAWLSFDSNRKTAEIKGVPTLENTDTLLNLSAVLEYYSR